ncbi:MAG: carbamoyltransferase [Saprospiraceae bacterium]
MYILGISAFYHDSAAALIKDGVVIAAAQEERFTRKKHDASFPIQAAKYCLDFANRSINDLDAVVFYDKPFLKFERLLETYYAFAPSGILSFINSMPIWLKEKLFLKRVIRQELKKVGDFDLKKLKLLFPEHHLSHAASAFYPSPFEKAAILTIDGVGEWATASISLGQGKDITVLKEMHFPHSLGLLYSAFTYFLGFKVNGGEYKLMGLAPYGNPNAENVSQFSKIIKTELADLKPDGSLWLNPKYFSYATGLRMVKDKKWNILFGFSRRLPESELEQKHCDLALAIQQFTEEVVLRMAREAKKITGSDHLCMAGGVALNCVANGKLASSNIFENIFIQPAAGDAGGALGAALAAHHIYFDESRKVENVALDAMSGTYLGPSFSTQEIISVGEKLNAKYIYYYEFDSLCKDVVALLEKEKIIGWMQGRMEFGPRALGNRSILGDPRNSEMQKKLNLKIKYRESFRPFAPSVLFKDSKDHFEIEKASPYMLMVQPVQESKKKKLPDDYLNLPMREKLYVQRSEIPSVTHVDGTARIQTVHKETNPRYWQLINTFKEKTGCSILVNTSFNVRGEPIVCSPEDAYRCFMRTEMDYLVIGDFLFKKEEQPSWEDKDNWKETFTLD